MRSRDWIPLRAANETLRFARRTLRLLRVGKGALLAHASVVRGHGQAVSLTRPSGQRLIIVPSARGATMRLPLLDRARWFRRPTPYCTAPFTAATIDPDKGVRPCSCFEGVLGNLHDSSLRDILGSPQWKNVRAEMERGDLPKGCTSCYEREKATGWSDRKLFIEARATKNGQWSKGFTELEINSTNVCNLACTHCSPDFSSRWMHLIKRLEQENVPHYRRTGEIHKADPEAMVRHVAGLDLSHLDVVCFKGGEPMLNPDVRAVLRYLDERGILKKVRVTFVTNGSVVDEEILDLLRRAESVLMSISVDGIGKVQEYIRRGPSEIPRIERFIEAFATLKKIEFTLSISIMAYNVFSLDRITQWWNGFRDVYPGKMRYPLFFLLEVISPPILSVNVLQDATRRELLAKYRGLSDANYAAVIAALEQPFGGAQIHNDFVEYTRGMDRIWKSDVLDAVPELASEMVHLDVPAGSAGAGDDPRAKTLSEGVSLTHAGHYEEAVRLYDRYLESQPASLASSWPIRLHRALVLEKMQKWEESLAELYGMIRWNPWKALAGLQRAKGEGSGSFFPKISYGMSDEVAVVETPSFRLLLEGLAHRALDQEPEAAAQLDRALALDPGFTLAAVAKREMHKWGGQATRPVGS